MSEVLLQTIVEKLESLEIALLKDNNAGKDKDETIQQTLLQEVKSVQSQIANLPLQFIASSEKIDKLLVSLSALNLRSDKPLQNQNKHTHHLHKGIWIAIGLFIISLLLSYGWIECYNSKKALEANGIKYRSLKVNHNISLLKLLYQTDSLYELNNEFFEKKVLKREQDLADREKSLRLTNGKKPK